MRLNSSILPDFARRRPQRHFLLAFTATIVAFGVYCALGFSPEFWDKDVQRADDDVWRISMSAAYTSLCFLALALGIGPLRVLRNRPVPLSIELRRDVGIWAGIAAPEPVKDFETLTIAIY